MSINKTYAVFGLGRYGLSVAKELVNSGAEVIAVDSNENIVNTVSTELPFCKCADTTDIEVLKRLGISNVDIAIVEVSSQAMKMNRVTGCKFDSVLFTNLSEDHISPKEHANMEEYFNAKLALAKLAPIVVTNLDNSYTKQLPKLLPDKKIITFSLEDTSTDIYAENYPDEYELAASFWEDFKDGKVKNSGAMTENGKKLLSWMQENVDTMTNLFTSKEAAEALFTSGRSIAGSMRKLVNDGYVEKTGKDPVQYSLTEGGKNYQKIIFSMKRTFGIKTVCCFEMKHTCGV